MSQPTDGTPLHHNPAFARASAADFRSCSGRPRPDLLLTVPTGPCAGRHVFAAELKLYSFAIPTRGDETAAESQFKREDLHQVHAYRDALSGLRSAWLLYSGSRFRFLPVADKVAKNVSEVPRTVDGVGGVSLRPGARPTILFSLIERLCPAPGAGSNHPVNKEAA